MNAMHTRLVALSLALLVLPLHPEPEDELLG